jgi:hypothetical protein
VPFLTETIHLASGQTCEIAYELMRDGGYCAILEFGGVRVTAAGATRELAKANLVAKLAARVGE